MTIASSSPPGRRAGSRRSSAARLAQRRRPDRCRSAGGRGPSRPRARRSPRASPGGPAGTAASVPAIEEQGVEAGGRRQRLQQPAGQIALGGEARQPDAARSVDHEEHAASGRAAAGPAARAARRRPRSPSARSTPRRRRAATDGASVAGGACPRGAPTTPPSPERVEACPSAGPLASGTRAPAISTSVASRVSRLTSAGDGMRSGAGGKRRW